MVIDTCVKVVNACGLKILKVHQKSSWSEKQTFPIQIAMLNVLKM